jgi:hypothetical protein
MTVECEQVDRQYAAELLNRIEGRLFDHRDVVLVAFVIPLIEADVAEWLNSNLRGTVSREKIVAAVRAGEARPDAEAKGSAQ